MAFKPSIIKGWDVPPKNARRVFQGRVFSIYQWKQKMFDGRVATYEAVWRPATVNIIATVGRKVLVTRGRAPGYAGGHWYHDLPGGRAGPGEKPLQAAKRELLEETGYVSRDWAVFWRERAWPVTRWMSYWYLARDCRKVGEPHPHANEIVQVEAVNLDTFLRRAESLIGSVGSEFTEMKYNQRKQSAFEKKAFGSATGPKKARRPHLRPT